jgi:hypothetical protein
MMNWKFKSLLLGGLFAPSAFLPVDAIAEYEITGGYLTDSQGHIIKSGYGLCVRTGYWTPAMAVAECDPDLVPKAAAKPAAPPRPKAAAKPRPQPPAPAPAVVQIEREGWAPFERIGTETTGFGLYTYVLFGYDPTGKRLSPKVKERYQRTLRALEPMAQMTLDAKMAGDIKKRTHLFLVPCKGQKDCLDIGQYNVGVSRSIREGLAGLLAKDSKRKTLAKTLTQSPGPFLVSSVKPLSNYPAGEKPVLLFIDFSSLSTECIESTIDKYRGYFRYEDVAVEDVTDLKRLKLTCEVRGVARAIFDAVPVALAKAKEFLPK